MRRIAAILLAAVLTPASAHAQEQYAALLLQYLSGDGDAALVKLAALPYPEIRAGVDAFETTRARMVLTGAAAMHTEVAFRRDGRFVSEFHLQVATALVEFGEHSGGKTNTPIALSPNVAAPVSDEFRRLWYCAVINGFESSVMLQRADRYLAHALKLYPSHPEIQMLAGIAEEMRASPRTSNVSAGDRRHALDQAEKHYRAVVAAAPDRLEARLRLARVLQQRDRFDEARTLLTPLSDTADTRIAYLASLFLGGIEDHDGHDDRAVALYIRAVARMPEAQTARLAASEILHRHGDRQMAAEAIPAAAGPGNAFDPWWTYAFGEYWRVEILLNAIRTKRQV
jgi:tetratricopeptide (TPR) repeat protein